MPRVKKNMKSRHIELENQDPKDIRRKELETLLKFSALINSSLNIKQVLNYAMQWAEEFMHAEASTVYELDKEKSELFVRIARGDKKDAVKDIRLNLGEGIAGHVVKTGQPMVVQDVTKEKIFSDKFDRKTGFKTRSLICVPLLLREKPVGALQVLNKRSGKPFSNSDLELLTSMSQQIVIALENAKLYQVLEKNFEVTAQDLKTTHEKLIRSQRLLACGHLVQGVAHEIRNPITTIGGFAKRIKASFPHDPRLQEYVNIILQESERLETLVKRVHDFTTLLSSTFELDDIKETVHEVVRKFRPLAERQGVNISADVDDAIPVSLMDSSQLEAALSNIMENALESMPQGGELSLLARYDQDHILVSISDTGCGIASENMESIYDPFFTSKTRGAGLGLTMSYQILMNHDGEITLQSEEGKGTTVTLSLPVKR